MFSKIEPQNPKAPPQRKIEYDDLVGQQRRRVVMPFTALKDKHIQNARFVLDRLALLRDFPPNGVCAEIGVASGDFSQKILDISQPQKLHLIDMWSSDRYGLECENLVLSRFSKEIASEQVMINRGRSTDVLSAFSDGYFDWVYIDTVHDYTVTAKELEICRHKVKKGGIIAGHDFVMGNWKSRIKYGVIEAVYEFCEKNNWEFLAITMELNGNSFAVKEQEN